MEAYSSEEFLELSFKIALILIISLPVLLLMRRWARSFFTKKYAPHYGILAGKVVFYTGLTILVITIMGQLGLSLAPSLGAAGIVGVAPGFASQTSVSNIITEPTEYIRVQLKFVKFQRSDLSLLLTFCFLYRFNSKRYP